MTRHILQSKHRLVSVARNNIEIFATVAAMAAGAVVPMPRRHSSVAAPTTATARAFDSTAAAGGTLGSVASPSATDSLAFNLIR